MALEAMDDLFGVTELIKKMDEENEHGDVSRTDSTTKGDIDSKTQRVEIAPVGKN